MPVHAPSKPTEIKESSKQAAAVGDLFAVDLSFPIATHHAASGAAQALPANQHSAALWAAAES
eukprot:2660109-Rhodomonas_salina.1